MLIIFLFIFLLNFFCFLFQEVVFIDFHMEEEGTRGWELRKKRKKNYSWHSAQGPGRMAQTPQAGTGDSVSRYRRYHCSNVINYDSYFPMGEQTQTNKKQTYSVFNYYSRPTF